MADAFTGVLVGFGDELRRDGVAVGTGDVLTYFAAMAALDPSDLADLYWAGRATLVSRQADIPVYNTVFRRYFLGADAPAKTRLLLRAQTAAEAEAALVMPSVDPGENPPPEEPSLGWMASNADVLKHRSFAACTPDELAALRRIMARMRLTPPRRRSRRYRGGSRRPPRSRAYLDMRKVARESMRTFGDPARLYFKRRKTRPRRLILILDVSGSMAEYSRHLLQFAHTARRAVPARAEVFCFGTRLTRITRELNRRKPDDALDQAARAVSDWDGGTRIGESLDTFVKRHARAGIARGAVVVICSDGLDRGDPEILADAMERLHRLCYRIVWLNPHDSRAALGMIAAAPHIDLLLSGHDLASLEELAAVLPGL